MQILHSLAKFSASSPRMQKLRSSSHPNVLHSLTNGHLCFLIAPSCLNPLHSAFPSLHHQICHGNPFLYDCQGPLHCQTLQDFLPQIFLLFLAHCFLFLNTIPSVSRSHTPGPPPLHRIFVLHPFLKYSFSLRFCPQDPLSALALLSLNKLQ